LPVSIAGVSSASVAGSPRARPICRLEVQGRFLTAANAISLARIPLAGAAVACLAVGERSLAMILLGAAFLTDALDGAVARATHSTSDWGRILDPLADKAIFAVLGVALAWLGLIPWWLAGGILARDLVIGIGGLRHIRRLGAIPESNAAGKLSTFVLAAYLCKQAFWPAPAWLGGLDPLGWIAVAVLLASTIVYARRYFTHRRHVLEHAVFIPLTR
jgi:phosphatidylglycerophosphate synthase